MKTVRLIASILICEFAGIIGTIYTIPAINSWYVTLMKPGFNPPAWIFGPVWTILYLLMGIALWLIWEKKGVEPEAKQWAIVIFIIQLLFNAKWSIIFFGMHSVSLALIDIILLWISILITIILFSKISKGAAWLLVPYILWVSFAGVLSFAIYLNYSIWALN